MANSKFVLEIEISETVMTGADVSRELQRLARRLQGQINDAWATKRGPIITNAGRMVGRWRLVEAEKEPFVLDLTDNERQSLAKMSLRRADEIEHYTTNPRLWPKQYERARRWREISDHLDPTTDMAIPGARV